MRPATLLVSVLAVVGVAGCASHKPPRPTITTRTSVTTAAATPARAVLIAFATSFGRYLDATVGAPGVLEVAPAVRGHLGPQLAPAARAGVLRVTSVSLAPLGDVSTVVLGDRRHTIPIYARVNRISGHDLVVSFTTGDLDSVAQAPGRATPQPHGSAAAQQAARAFLVGYLPWLYGRANPTAIRAVAPRLARQLKGQSLPQAPGAPNLHPQVVAVGMQGARSGWVAAANIADSQRTYELNLTVVHQAGVWEVERVQVAGQS